MPRARIRGCGLRHGLRQACDRESRTGPGHYSRGTSGITLARELWMRLGAGYSDIQHATAGRDASMVPTPLELSLVLAARPRWYARIGSGNGSTPRR